MAAAPKSQYFLILSFCLDGNEVRKRQSGGGKKNWNGCWTNLEMIPSLEMALISSVHKNVKKYEAADWPIQVKINCEHKSNEI